MRHSIWHSPHKIQTKFSFLKVQWFNPTWIVHIYHFSTASTDIEILKQRK
jgi:hypothetical protein